MQCVRRGADPARTCTTSLQRLRVEGGHATCWRPRPMDVTLPIPPMALVRCAVAAVWLYEGLWCKLLGREAPPGAGRRGGPAAGPARRPALPQSARPGRDGAGRVGAVGRRARACAPSPRPSCSSSLNANGLLWARHIIHDPGGMVVKNVSFLLLAWVGGGDERERRRDHRHRWHAGRFDARAGRSASSSAACTRTRRSSARRSARGPRLLHRLGGLHGARPVRAPRGRRVRHQPRAARLRRAADRRGRRSRSARPSGSWASAAR